MKKILLLIIPLIICLCFSGCGIDFTSVEGLMRPPKLSGENSLLQTAFEKSFNSNKTVIMKTPVSGENRSSFLYYDLDNDGVKEALVFYSDPSVDEFACAGIFKLVDNNWQSVSSIKGSGEEIFEVDFADVNGDGRYEIVICWTYIKASDSKNTASFTNVSDRIVSVYSYNGNSVTHVISRSFSKMIVADFNGDSSAEIMLVSIDLSNNDKRTTAKVIGFDSDYTVDRNYSFPLTGMIDVLNIEKDETTVNGEKHTRIFIDGGISETAIITEVVDISHNGFEISLPLYSSNISENPCTIRDVRAFCTDIDDDGEIEIPTLESLPYGSVINNDNSSNSLNLTVWSKLDDGEMKIQMKCLLNSSSGYMFVFPEEWENNVTAVYNSATSTLRFYRIDENGTLGDEIFSIRAFPETKWKENNYNYIRLASSGVMVFGYTVSENCEELYVDYITDNFVILN